MPNKQPELREDAAAVIERERAHYDEHRRYLLHFLECGRTEADRWLIRRTMLTWDRQLALLDPALFCSKRVLEAGCGNPRMLFYARRLGATRAIGVDLSPAFVARGLRHPLTYAGPHALPVEPEKIELLYGDFTGAVTEGLAVDTIICFQSLHHFDLERFAARCDGLLTPGGHVAISDPLGDHPLRRLGDRVGRRSGLLSPDERALSPARVVAAFAERGYSVVQWHSLNPTLEIYFQITELFTPLSGRLAFWLKLPLALLRPLEDRLERTLLSRRPRWGWRYLLVLRKDGGNT